MEGEGRGERGEAGAGAERRGRKDGRGVSIQTQTITKPSKAARGRLCRSRAARFLGQGLELEHNKWRSDDGRRGRAGRPAARASGVRAAVCGDADQGGLAV